MPIELTPIPASDTYSADADVENQYGTYNVAAWGSLNADATTEEIAARIQWARGEAKILIDEELVGAGLTAPATADNFTFFDSLKSIEAELAGTILYQSRGIADRQQQAGDTDGVMQGHYERAMARLAKRIADHIARDDDDDTATAGTFQFIPINRGPATDEYAN